MKDADLIEGLKCICNTARLDILRVLGESRQPMTAPAIASLLEMSVVNVLYHLNPLRRRRFIASDGDGDGISAAYVVDRDVIRAFTTAVTQALPTTSA